MTWREIEVTGHFTRSAIEQSARDGATIELQLAEDALPPFSWELYDMWFVQVTLTGIDTTADSDWIDTADEPMTSVCFTGTITDSDIPIRLIFFGDVLDRFMVDQ